MSIVNVSRPGAIVRLATIAVLLGGVACAPVNPPRKVTADGTWIERTDRNFELPPTVNRVAVDNPWGEIAARGRDERAVGLHAVVQRSAPGHARPEFTSRVDGGTLRITIGFAGSDPADATSKRGRIDVAVYVPGQLPIALSTRDGRIKVGRRIGPVEARTASGSIQAVSRGRMVLTSQSGAIRAMAFGKRWSGASTVTTDTGAIVFAVPTFGDIVLDARTTGKLTTRFGLSVHTMPDGIHAAHARYGAGVSGLTIRSRTGDIALEQMILLGDDTHLPEDDD